MKSDAMLQSVVVKLMTSLSSMAHMYIPYVEFHLVTQPIVGGSNSRLWITLDIALNNACQTLLNLMADKVLLNLSIESGEIASKDDLIPN